MNVESDPSQPLQLTDFERLALELLQSIDQRLKSLDATGDWFYERIRGVDRAQQSMRDITERWRQT